MNDVKTDRFFTLITAKEKNSQRWGQAKHRPQDHPPPKTNKTQSINLYHTYMIHT